MFYKINPPSSSSVQTDLPIPLLSLLSPPYPRRRRRHHPPPPLPVLSSLCSLHTAIARARKWRGLATQGSALRHARSKNTTDRANLIGPHGGHGLRRSRRRWLLPALSSPHSLHAGMSTVVAWAREAEQTLGRERAVGSMAWIHGGARVLSVVMELDVSATKRSSWGTLHFFIYLHFSFLRFLRSGADETDGERRSGRP